MRVGFTGTQLGTTPQQLSSLWIVLGQLKPVEEFHHGDCIGSDAEAHDLVRRIFDDSVIVIHPPTIETKRAFKGADIYRDPKDYMDRNQDIVNETDILIATPAEDEEKIRSGTWSTIRKARKRGMSVVLIYPSGSIDRAGVKVSSNDVQKLF